MPAVMSVGLVGNLLSIRVLRSPNIDMKVEIIEIVRWTYLCGNICTEICGIMYMKIIDVVRWAYVGRFSVCVGKLLSILELRRHNIIDTIIGWALSSQ